MKYGSKLCDELKCGQTEKIESDRRGKKKGGLKRRRWKLLVGRNESAGQKEGERKWDWQEP